VLALVFLTLGGTVLGFGAYTWLLQVTTPAAAGSYAFVNPVIALGLAWLVGDGELSLRVGVAAAVVVCAVTLTRPHNAITSSRAQRGSYAAVPEMRRPGPSLRSG
jgi:drug/metabolite transporter (DMT)-like permease